MHSTDLHALTTAEVGFHIFNTFCLHSPFLLKWLLKAFMLTDLSWNEPLTHLEGRCKPPVLVHICTTGRDFLSDGFVAKPSLLLSSSAIWKMSSRPMAFVSTDLNGCLADYCIGSLLHNCRLCLCALRVRWILGHARASQERGQLQLTFGCREARSAVSKEFWPSL